MNQQELQRILLMPEGLRAQYLAALKKPQKMADGGGFGRKAQRINQATSFGDEPMGNQIIKETGGNWLGGNVEKALDPLTRTVLNDTGVNNLRSRQGDEVANAYLKERPRHEAANNWVRGNLTNYVKKQMATEADPVRKLAEQGISHFPVVDDPRFWNRKGESAREALSGRQVGKSDLAKQWENRSDSMIERDTAQEHQDMMHLAPGLYSEKDAWIKNAPPETKIHKTAGNRPGFNAADLGFDHIMDVLKEDLAEGRIRPEQLSKISMEQAVRRVHEYDQDKLKKMREAQIKNTEGMPVHKVYNDGHKWIELAMPKGEAALSDLGKQIMAKHKAEGTEPSPGVLEQAIKQGGEEKLREALKYEGDAMGHCVGGYCPDVMEGRSRIFSLRDAKGEPHVTVETEPLHGAELGRYAADLPEGKDVIAMKNPPHRIVQIKGKGNGKPVAKYIPMVQDFVKSHSWADVGDLHNTDLIHLDPKSDLAQAIQANGEKPPRYITNQELTDLSKKHNFPTWVNNVQKKADGGSIKASERDANLAQFLKDSAVKDRMYHATSHDFSEFADNPRGVHFVTPSANWANKFLSQDGGMPPDPLIMPLHVSVKNPFDYANKKHRDALAVKASIGKLGMDEIKKGKWGRIEDRTTLKAIKDLGHDSVYVKENGIKNLGVFDPNQIKSAIGNRGTYDLNNPDITKAQGGSIKPVGYTKEKVTVSPSLDRMQYELMSVKHFKKAK